MTSIPRNTNWGTAAASIEQLVDTAIGAAVIEANNYTDGRVEALTNISPATLDILQAFDGEVDIADAVIAGAITDTGSATTAALHSRFSRAKLIDANRHGVKADGSTDDRAAWQAIVNAAPYGSVITWTGNSILKGPVIWKPGVSLVGQGWGKSVLSTLDATGSSYFPAIQYLSGDGASAANPLTDCRFHNFEVDGSGLSGTSPHISGKAIFAQWLVRCWFTNLYLHDTVGTALGTDYMPDCIIAGNLVERGGRNWNGAAGGHAGIGIGTGAWEHENVLIMGNTVRDCGHWGIFVEYQSGEPHQGTGARIIGNTIMGGQGFGIGDRGARGTLIANNLVVGPAKSGIVLTYGAQDDIITGNHVYNAGQNGIHLESNVGRSDITGNTVLGSTLHGISIRSEDSMTVGIHPDGYMPRNPGLRVRGNRVCRNGAVGIYATSVGGTSGVDDLEITDNLCSENGRTHGSYKQGIRIEANSNHVDISRNRIYDRQTVPTQTGGININLAGGTYTVASGRVYGNNLTGQANPTSLPAHITKTDNLGAGLENKGVGTIANGAATVNIPHGCVTPPTRVFVTPRGGELIWVDTVGVSGVIYRRAGTTGDLSFSWSVEV